jgi:hypothetical protein
MRKSDVEVKEVVCSETGKPMPKIPLWMADVKVKFVSDEARQKHPSPQSLADIEPLRRGLSPAGEIDELKGLDAVVAIEDEDADFEEAEAEETADEYVDE